MAVYQKVKRVTQSTIQVFIKIMHWFKSTISEGALLPNIKLNDNSPDTSDDIVISEKPFLIQLKTLSRLQHSKYRLQIWLKISQLGIFQISQRRGEAVRSLVGEVQSKPSNEIGRRPFRCARLFCRYYRCCFSVTNALRAAR